MEILVAIALFSIIMLTLFSSFDAFISSSQSITGTVEEELQARTAMNRIRQDLQSIFVVAPPWYTPPNFDDEPDPFRLLGTTENLSGSPFSRLEFASLAHVRPGDAEVPDGIAKIVYYVRKNESGTLDLCRSDVLMQTDKIPDPCRDPVIARHIQSFDIQYKDIKKDTHEEFDSDNGQFDYTFPDTIVFKLGFISSQGSIRHFETAVALPVNRGPID